ncbi:MAG: TerB family tellurite resistance protein [Rhodospirillaceae bacterium]|nr:TerB family tellurite resistance protein [Rhodospirillaceae bacterium]
MKWLFVDDRAEEEHSRDELEVAVCVLLCQAARMDDDFDLRERDTIRQLMRERFGLPEAEAEALVEAADAKAEASADLWQYARLVKERFTHPERIEMIEMLWEVAYADGVLHDYEAHLLRRIAGLIYVTDQERGTSRKRVLARLGIEDPAT